MLHDCTQELLDNYLTSYSFSDYAIEEMFSSIKIQLYIYISNCKQWRKNNVDPTIQERFFHNHRSFIILSAIDSPLPSLFLTWQADMVENDFDHESWYK